MTKKDAKYIRGLKCSGKIVMLTAYDYMTASILDGLDIDILLVGDSLANVMLGYETTLPVTMEEMLHHTRAVARATQTAMVVGDMPFMSYQVSKKEAARNAGRFLKEASAQGVKIEGGSEMAGIVEKIVNIGIPVMGHLGLTPQSVNQIGLNVQGKESKEAEKMIDDAKALASAGVFSIVLECIPKDLAKSITEAVSIPTIGIGAGIHCDGQVLVTHDMLGLYKDRVPKFVKQYAQLRPAIENAVTAYREEVRSGSWPDDSYSYGAAKAVETSS